MKLNETLGQLAALDYVDGIAVGVILSQLVKAATNGKCQIEIPREEVSFGDRHEKFTRMTAWSHKHGIKFSNALEGEKEIWVFEW